MKKSLFFVAAASALMLTACSSENDVLQDATQQTTVQQRAVGFDIYTPAATEVTRAGFVGTLNTTRLQRNEDDATSPAQWRVGFGVYAFYSDQSSDTDYSDELGYPALNSTYVPNFMWNEKILWDNTAKGWYYSPLKYWPNETANDSQADEKAYMERKANSRLDQLTFFAYAPYVENGVSGEPGITAITKNDGTISGSTATDPSVEYHASFTDDDGTSSYDDPSKGVDLLWGVAPAGGLNYTAVNGNQIAIPEGLPLINMVKPDVNTTMKFLFEHALARIGVTVAAAIDQLPQGGKLDENTKITIERVKLTGYFGERGRLNLNNDKKDVKGKPIANWRVINGIAITAATSGGSKDLKKQTIVIEGDNIKGNLRYKAPYDAPVEQPVVGVTTAKQDLIAPSTNHYGKFTADAAFDFDPAKIYYTSDGATHPTFTEAHATYTLTASDRYYTKDGSGIFTLASGATLTTPDYPEALMSDYYTVTETPYTSVAHYYTSAEVTAQNVTGRTNALIPGVTRYLEAGMTFTADEATIYRTIVTTSDAAEGNTITTNQANTYNTHFSLTEGDRGYVTTSDIKEYVAPTIPTGEKLYSRTGDASPYTYTNVASPEWNEAGKTYYALAGTQVPLTAIGFKYAADTYYTPERNFYMVVPTNNIPQYNTTWASKEKDLRTIDVEITYYITTEDAKLSAGRSQTKNVITKTVELPSLDNGKSYNLNLLLGLTSVKVEADVADWKEEYVQVDLPQNTAE